MLVGGPQYARIVCRRDHRSIGIGHPDLLVQDAGLPQLLQTKFGGLTVAANIDFGLQFAGRTRAGSWLLKDEQSILNLIGLAAQSAVPAAEVMAFMEQYQPAN